MHKIKVNDRLDYNVERKDGKLIMNEQDAHADIRQLGSSVYHIISDLKSYNAEVVSFDKTTKTAAIKVNGTIYNVVAKDQYDLLLDKLGLSDLNSAKISEVK